MKVHLLTRVDCVDQHQICFVIGYVTIEVLQGARLSLNGFSHHRFSTYSLAFSAILRVNGIGHSIAKTIVTISI